jgi:hypothetical protein
MTNTMKRNVSPIQIYMAPSFGAHAPWRVSDDCKEGGFHEDFHAAIGAACERARALEEIGFDVQVMG